MNEISKKYESILKDIIVSEGIKCIVCTNTKEHYFDRIEYDSADGSIKYYINGYAFQSLGFDQRIDYAKMLFYIEEDLFLFHHCTPGKHGMLFQNTKKKLVTEDIKNIFKSYSFPFDWYIEGDGEVVVVSVEDGDWKHDHIALDNVMRANGFKLIDVEKCDDDTSDDCYSAVYRFKKCL